MIDALDPALLARNYLLVRLRYYHDIVAGNRSQAAVLQLHGTRRGRAFKLC